ncbi:MAG: hypothetical protein IKV75_02165 [Bacteroidales bacterium]|nr:hypothetical protein [Bacteroidales bacterium]
MKLFLISLSLMLLMGCSEKPMPELSADKDFDFIKVDGKYVMRFHPISKEEFNEKFQSAWTCNWIYDVYPDGTVGELNVIEVLDGGMPVPPLRVLPYNSIEVSFTYNIPPFDSYYKVINYSYDESKNELYLREFPSSFSGGTVVSITEEEMKVIAPIWDHRYSDSSSIKNLYRFIKSDKEAN